MLFRINDIDSPSINLRFAHGLLMPEITALVETHLIVVHIQHMMPQVSSNTLHLRSLNLYIQLSISGFFNSQWTIASTTYNATHYSYLQYKLLILL